MKILLVKPWAQMPTNYPPLGLAYIAVVLENMGQTVQILDLTVESMSEERLGSYLLEQKPDVIGITCMITEFNGALRVASISKEMVPNSTVIVGGPLPTSIPSTFLSQPFIDVVVIGEGEKTIVELMDRLERNETLDGVQGTAYKKYGEQKFNPPREPIIDLDSLPFPARHLLPMERYFSSFDNWFGHGSRIKATNMISSRGCPYNCIYCDRKATGSKLRKRSAANVVDEMQFLVEKYHVNGVIFSDDMFDIDRRRVYQICDEIKQRGLDVVWGVNSRVNHANEEMYKKMRQSGCMFVAFGIESGNQGMLDFMQKRITLKQAIKAVNMAKRAGLRTVGYFMIGMLGENKKMIKQTIQFAKGLNLDSGGFSKVVPIPGTTLYDLAKREGIIDDDDFIISDRFGGTVNLARDLSSKEIDRLCEQAYWEFFWSRPSRRLRKPFSSLISDLFPIIYAALGGKTDVFLRLNRIRETLHLPLP